MNGGGQVEMKLELVQVPVSDIDRAKELYVERAGFNADRILASTTIRLPLVSPACVPIA